MAEKKEKLVNSILVKGILAEKNLEIKTTRTGKKYISGDIVVKTGENSLHKFKVYTFEMKKDDVKNPYYEGLVTVMNEHKSIAQHGDDADAVEVKAQFDIDDYKNREGIVVSFVQKVVFNVTRINKEQLETQANGEVHIYLDKVREEVTKDGEETGRAVVTGFVKKYNGEVFPVEFKVSDPRGVEFFLDKKDDRGELLKVFFKLVNNTIEDNKEVEVVFGEAPKKSFKKTVNETIIYSLAYGEESLKMTEEDFEKAVAERELKLNEVKNKTNETTSAKQTSSVDIGDFPF